MVVLPPNQLGMHFLKTFAGSVLVLILIQSHSGFGWKWKSKEQIDKENAHLDKLFAEREKWTMEMREESDRRIRNGKSGTVEYLDVMGFEVIGPDGEYVINRVQKDRMGKPLYNPVDGLPVLTPPLIYSTGRLYKVPPIHM